MWASLLAALILIPTHTWVGTGPTLAGSKVVWAVNAPSPAVYAASPPARIWRARRVLLPPDIQNDPFFDIRATQRISTLAASARRTAFIRRIDLQLVPKCASQTPPCMAIPVRLKAWRSELWTGARGGPFKHVNHGFALDTDVDDGRVLYSDTNRVVLDRTLVSSNDVDYPDVALAGHYAAWTEVPHGKNLLYTPRALVVYDLSARRVAYRLDTAPFGDIDLARDGTVAFGQDPTPRGGSDGGVGWASVAEPRPHYLVGNAIPFDVRLAAGWIAYSNRSRLVVQRLDGEVIALQQAAYGGFDFDGRRLAYLHGPKEIAVTRLR